MKTRTRQRKQLKDLRASAATTKNFMSSGSIRVARSNAPPVPSKSTVLDPIRPMPIEPVPVASLHPYPGNPRTHSKKQIRQIADSIRQFGFTNPF
jgi:hypothetical protein